MYGPQFTVEQYNQYRKEHPNVQSVNTISIRFGCFSQAKKDAGIFDEVKKVFLKRRKKVHLEEKNEEQKQILIEKLKHAATENGGTLSVSQYQKWNKEHSDGKDSVPLINLLCTNQNLFQGRKNFR